jgi:endo-1,4-beta-D-glucanase Y
MPRTNILFSSLLETACLLVVSALRTAAAHANANTPDSSFDKDRYDDGLLYLLGMPHYSGEFRIWPQRQPASYQD